METDTRAASRRDQLSRRTGWKGYDTQFLTEPWYGGSGSCELVAKPTCHMAASLMQACKLY